MPKSITTGEENSDKAGFGFLHVCSVDMSGWTNREIQMREEVGATVKHKASKAAVLTHDDSLF